MLVPPRTNCYVFKYTAFCVEVECSLCVSFLFLNTTSFQSPIIFTEGDLETLICIWLWFQVFICLSGKPAINWRLAKGVTHHLPEDSWDWLQQPLVCCVPQLEAVHHASLLELWRLQLTSHVVPSLPSKLWLKEGAIIVAFTCRGQTQLKNHRPRYAHVHWQLKQSILKICSCTIPLRPSLVSLVWKKMRWRHRPLLNS